MIKNRISTQGLNQFMILWSRRGNDFASGKLGQLYGVQFSAPLETNQ
jgi:hypothetical protein